APSYEGGGGPAPAPAPGGRLDHPLTWPGGGVDLGGEAGSCYQIPECWMGAGGGVAVVPPASAARASASVRAPFQALHALWIRAALSRAYSAPPRATGTMWSTSGAAGCRAGRVVSTGWPQRAQWVSSARTRARSWRPRWPLLQR